MKVQLKKLDYQRKLEEKQEHSFISCFPSLSYVLLFSLCSLQARLSNALLMTLPKRAFLRSTEKNDNKIQLDLKENEQEHYLGPAIAKMRKASTLFSVNLKNLLLRALLSCNKNAKNKHQLIWQAKSTII